MSVRNKETNQAYEEKEKMKRRIEDGKIFLSFNYNMGFAGKLKKYCGAKWKPDTKEWYFDLQFEDKSNDLLLKEYGFSYRSDERMTVTFEAWDFFDKSQGEIIINGIAIAWRKTRDSEVTLRSNTIIRDGDFPRSGGSSRYPSVFKDEEEARGKVVLESKIYKEFYDTLSDEDKSKLTIVQALSERDVLLARKHQLLNELKELEEKLKNL